MAAVQEAGNGQLVPRPANSRRVVVVVTKRRKPPPHRLVLAPAEIDALRVHVARIEAADVRAHDPFAERVMMLTMFVHDLLGDERATSLGACVT